MKKYILLLTKILVAAFLASCGGGDDVNLNSSTKNTSPDSADPSSLRIGAQGDTPAENSEPSIRPSRVDVEVVHDSKSNACTNLSNGSEFERITIDSPVRAFQDSNGRQHLIFSNSGASAFNFYATREVWSAMDSKNPYTIQCDPVFKSHNDSNPKNFNQRIFAQGVFFKDGDYNNLVLLGHNEFWVRDSRFKDPSDEMTKECKFKLNGNKDLKECRYVSVSSHKTRLSDDGDGSFTLDSGKFNDSNVSIFPNAQYPAEHSSTTSSGWIGYGVPSNIFQGRDANGDRSNYYYMYAYANVDYKKQEKGRCLFRTTNPIGIQSWKGWSGDFNKPKFDQIISNPYTISSTDGNNCNPIAIKDDLRSVVYYPKIKKYVGFVRRKDDIAFITSSDLLNWSDAQSVVTFEQIRGDNDFEIAYPSVVDHASGGDLDRNFDTIQGEKNKGLTYLYLRMGHPDKGHTYLVRIKLKFV